MKRFLSILLALALALTLGIPALAAEHRAGDTYIRILGSSGARTVGVRTTYGAYRQTADGAVYRDDRYEFVYTDDGVSWVSAGAAESSLGSGMYDGTQFLAGPFGSERPTWCSADGGHWTALTPEEQDTAPAIQRGRSSLNGLTFTLRGGRELWVTDGQGRAVELTADFTSFLASYDMADVQAYPVPQGIRVEVYSRYGYETGASHTYPAAELKQRLAAAQPELLRVTVDGKPVTFPISLYQVSGCTMAPLRQMAQALGYTFDYDGSSGTAVCARGTDTISCARGQHPGYRQRQDHQLAGGARRAARWHILCTRPILCRGGGGGCDLGCGGADLLPHHSNSGGVNMRRRAISALAAALALVLTLVTPALAAGRPNWDGPLGAMAGPVVCETGRDYVLSYTIIGGVYRSADGVTWTELDRQWASAGWAYGTGVNGLAHKEFQFLWTGSEYMMRQSLLDDPREDTHQQYGDSPRNNWVTLLDEGFRIIGAKAFDGPVTDIRYAGGTYYATVDGVEHAFTRTDWEPGREGGVYYSGTAWYKQENQRKPVEVTSYLIREQPGNNGPFGLAVSTDGYSWLPLETKLTPDMMRLSETGGGAVVYYSPYDGSLYYYDYRGSRFAGACTAGWVEADLGFDPAEGVGTAWVDYTFRWTGDGYLMCQSVTGRG